MEKTKQIHGYTYGAEAVPASPIDREAFALLQDSVLWSDEDERYRRLAGEVLRDQVDDVLDVWYGFVGAHPHLLHYFEGPNGVPLDGYLAQVRERFGQWILDTCLRDYNQTWLDYQMEIGLRHHRIKKNQTDGVEAPPIIPLRYLLAFIYPITATIRPFLAKKGHEEADVEKMHQAWFKSVVLQVTLWAFPYVHEGDF